MNHLGIVRIVSFVTLALLVSLALIFAGHPAQADDDDGNPQVADIQNRLTALEDQVRTLTGRIDEIGHRVDQTNQDLQNFKADTELHFQDIQKGGATAGAAPLGGPVQNASAPDEPSQLAPAQGVLGQSQQSMPIAAAAVDKPGAATGVTLPAGTAQVQYEFAVDKLKRGQFDEARDAFKLFIRAHPRDPLAGNAQYWLGETYYVQGQYKEAADSFLKGYTTYSKSVKAPDSLLKLGMTLSALGQKDAACATFGELGRRFPHAEPAVVERNKAERKKTGC